MYTQSLIAAAMVSYGTIDSLIDFFSFTAWIFYGGAMFALIVMRYTKPNYPRPYKVPIIIPYVVLIISVYLVIGPIIDKPQIEYLYAVLFILAGLVFYIPFVKMGLTPRFMGMYIILSSRYTRIYMHSRLPLCKKKTHILGVQTSSRCSYSYCWKWCPPQQWEMDMTEMEKMDKEGRRKSRKYGCTYDFTQKITHTAQQSSYPGCVTFLTRHSK